MKTFFGSDLHFDHKRIIEYTDRKDVITQEHHTEWLIDTWNSQVSKSDKVFHLGDFSFSHKYNEIASVVKRLNGQKFFLKGNHDRSEVLDRLKDEHLIQDWWHYKEIKIQGNTACLFHFPIVSWHKRGYGSFCLHGHCVDMQTELLTTGGWKKFGEFTTSDTVPTFNFETNETVISPVLKVFNPTYSGSVFTLRGKSANLRMTEGHRIVGKILHSGKPADFTASSPPVSKVKLIHSLKSNKTDAPISDDLLKLYIYCTADGSLKENTGLWRIRVKKEHKKVEIRRVLTALNKSFNAYEKGDYVSFNFYTPELSHLASKGLDKSLRKLSDRQFKVLMEAYSLSDGSRNGNGVLISTAKPQEVDLIQELAVTHGWSCTVLSRIHGYSKNVQYQLSVYPRTEAECSGIQKMEVEQVQDEKFWCIQTTTGNFMIRRNGKVHLTGNCHSSLPQDSGRILDVGIDNSYKLHGEHKLFSEQDVLDFMQGQEVYSVDHHKVIVE